MKKSTNVDKLRRACITKGIIAIRSPKLSKWILLRVYSVGVPGHVQGHWKFPGTVRCMAQFAHEEIELRALPRKGGKRPFPRRREIVQRTFRSEEDAYKTYLLTDEQFMKWR